MDKSSELKLFLESSLNSIFKATVNEILDSVERTLSEYQGAMQRIQSENEGLKRLLFAQKSPEPADCGGTFSSCLRKTRSFFFFFFFVISLFFVADRYRPPPLNANGRLIAFLCVCLSACMWCSSLSLLAKYIAVGTTRRIITSVRKKCD